MKYSKKLKKLLCEGYLEMYDIAKQMADDFAYLDKDSLKYID